MKQWTEEDLNWYLGDLASNDSYKISLALYTVSALDLNPPPMPTGNAKVISHLEQLVEDHRVCKVRFGVPFTYGEIRWLAARVLACEYAYQGIEKPIILKDVIQPVTDHDIVDISGDIRATLKDLVQRGIALRKTEIIKPQDYAWCCSKKLLKNE